MQNNNGTDAANRPRFLVPLPGGRVARVPIEVLESYVDTSAVLLHDAAAPHDDVTAHHMQVDTSTGSSAWHTEWEYGPCQYTDESGFPQQGFLWHRHPLGTEYTEIYQQ